MQRMGEGEQVKQKGTIYTSGIISNMFQSRESYKNETFDQLDPKFAKYALKSLAL